MPKNMLPTVQPANGYAVARAVAPDSVNSGMNNVVWITFDDTPRRRHVVTPRGGRGERKKWRERGKLRLSNLGRSMVGFFFALQMIIMLAGLVVLPFYLFYEFVIR